MIVTFSGGSGVLSVDQCERAGLVTPHLSQSTRERLKSLVPPTASIANPVDLTAPAAFNRPEWQARFPVSLDAIAADPNVDVVLMQFGPMAHGGPEIAQAVCDFSLRVEKALCLSWRLAPAGVPELLREHKMHFFEEDNRAIEVVAKLAASGSLRAARDKRHGSPVSFNWGEFVPESRPNLVVTEHDCHRLLAAFGLQTARGRLAVSEQDVLDAALAVSWPVALKAISPAVTHRAAAGLLALGVTSDDEARAEYRRLIDQAATLAVSLDGVYVQQMEDEGAELLVSAFRDSTFGVVVSCGAGGVMTESLDDVTFELAPVDAEGALEMLQRLRVVKGLRHLNPGVNLAAVADYIAEFSRLAATAPWQRFVFELNPVKWGGERVVAVDALLIIDSP